MKKSEIIQMINDSIENKNLCRVWYIVVGNIKETYAK